MAPRSLADDEKCEAEMTNPETTKAFDKIMEGATEALAIARGEKEPARVTNPETAPNRKEPR